jgi:hypothetical protein
MAFSNESQKRAWLATFVVAAWAASGAAAIDGCVGGPGGDGGAAGPLGSSSTSSGSNGGSSGNSVSADNTTPSGATSGGATTGSGGSTSGANGTTTAGPPGCVSAVSPVLIDFDRYSPTGPAGAEGFDTYFGSGNAVGYIGPYAYSGVMTNTSITPVTGRTGGTIDGSTDWGLNLTVTQESVYGAGLGLWMSCLNASSYKGISFWARGQTPIGTCSADAGGGSCFNVVLSTASTTLSTDGGAARCMGTSTTCVEPTASNLQLTTTWTPFRLAWSQFVGGMANGSAYVPTGDGLIGLSFGLSLVYQGVDAGGDAGVVYQPVPADLDFQIDDIELMP